MEGGDKSLARSGETEDKGGSAVKIYEKRTEEDKVRGDRWGKEVGRGSGLKPSRFPGPQPRMG